VKAAGFFLTIFISARIELSNVFKASLASFSRGSTLFIFAFASSSFSWISYFSASTILFSCSTSSCYLSALLFLYWTSFISFSVSFFFYSSSGYFSFSYSYKLVTIDSVSFSFTTPSVSFYLSEEISSYFSFRSPS